MEPSRVVEILQDGKSRGSGYLIAPRHVLTARHVPKPPVVGTDCVVYALRGATERAIPSAQEPRPQPVPAKVGWVSAEHDFALIEITGEPLGSPKTGQSPLGRFRSMASCDRSSVRGFPKLRAPTREPLLER
jgi:hypothetical protein